MGMPFRDPDLEAKFQAYASPMRAALLDIRDLILTTGTGIPAVGELIETIKWGQPAYLPAERGIGTTIRLDAFKGSECYCGVFFHCQTTLVPTFRELYGDQLTFEGNRAVVLSVGERLPRNELRHCVSLALTYHQQRTRRVSAQRFSTAT